MNVDPEGLCPQPPDRRLEPEAYKTHMAQSFKRSSAPILDDLALRGYPVDSLSSLAGTYGPLPNPVVEVLLRWLPKTNDIKVSEWLVRELAAAKGPYDGRPLIELFDRSSSEHLRWVIGNTLALSSATNVVPWLLSAARNPEYGRARQTLILAIPRHAPAEEGRAALLACFDDFPGHASEALAKIGGPSDLDFLTGQRRRCSGWVGREIDAAIRRIRKRVERDTKR
jgi:hypothetical protein